MSEKKYFSKTLIGILGCDFLIKIIFIIIGIKRLLKIKKDMSVEKKYLLYQNLESFQFQIIKEKWTFPSMVKFISNILIVLLYFSSMIIYIIFYVIKDNFNDNDNDNKNDLDSFLIFIMNVSVSCISFIAWVISTRLFYKEFRIYKDQTWNGIRIFWILNAIINIIELVLNSFYYEYWSLNSFNVEIIIPGILLATISFISLIPFLLAIFHPYDVSLIKQIKKEENIINDNRNETKISTDIQDDLLINSEDEFGNEDEISFHKMETIKIELNDNEGFNKKEYYIDLKIRTKDFKQLIFSIKIEKVKHKRVKNPITVSNFNEVILKYYKNKNASKDVINLLKQAYSISLTLNPQRTSFTGEKKNTNLLAHLYGEIIKKDYQFLLDLLHFLKIKNDGIIKCLSDNNYTSIYEENPSIEKEIEKMDILGSIFDDFENVSISDINNSSIKKKKPLDNNTFPKTDIKVKSKFSDSEKENTSSENSITTLIKNSLTPKDYTSFSTFINNILINKRFITVQIVSYEDKSENINLILRNVKDKDKNEIILKLNIDLIHDMLFDDELASYIIDYSENINNNNSKEKQMMEELFTSYINNLFYYDENLYETFNLNQFINLDIDKLNNEVIYNFFNEKISNKGLFQDDIRQFLFDIKIKNYNDINDIKPLINDGNIEISLSKTNLGEILDDDIKNEFQINITKLYLIMENMIYVLNNIIESYSELSGTLNNIKIYDGKLLNIIYNIKEDQLKNIKNYRIKEVSYGDTKINLIVLEFKKRFSDNKITINEVNKDLINDINKEIENINTCFDSLLNKSNLKYVLYFSCFRDLLEFSNLF